jgi:hypothetical protein
LAEGILSGDITDAEAGAAVTSGDIGAILTDLLTSVGFSRGVRRAQWCWDRKGT